MRAGASSGGVAEVGTNLEEHFSGLEASHDHDRNCCAHGSNVASACGLEGGQHGTEARQRGNEGGELCLKLQRRGALPSAAMTSPTRRPGQGTIFVHRWLNELVEHRATSERACDSFTA